MFQRIRNSARSAAYASMPSLAGLFLGLFALYALSLPLLSGDLGWHIRLGAWILDKGAVPRRNIFSFTAPWYPWHTHEWLSGVFFALLDKAGGLPLLFLARASFFVATLGILYRLGRKVHADPLLLAGFLLLEGVTLALHVSLRPWVFSNLFLSLMLHLSLKWRFVPDNYFIPWFIVFLLGLWINLHGAFMVGLAYGAWLFLRLFLQRSPEEDPRETKDRRFNALNALLVLGGLIALNPFGTDALVLPLLYLTGEESSGMALSASIKEWAPLELNTFFGRIYLIWAALSLATLLRTPRLIRRPEFTFGLLMMLLTLKSQRHFPLAAIFLFPVIAEGLLRWTPKPASALENSSTKGKWREKWIVFSKEEGRGRGGFYVLLSLALLGWYGRAASSPDFEAHAFQARAYPMEAIRVLAGRPPGRLFNHYDWAGILEWKVPQWPLFITPANDAYPRSVFEDWFAIANLEPGWDKRLEAWRVDTLLMPADSTLALVLSRTPGWKVVTGDDKGMLLIRVPDDASETHKAGAAPERKRNEAEKKGISEGISDERAEKADDE